MIFSSTSAPLNRGVVAVAAEREEGANREKITLVWRCAAIVPIALSVRALCSVCGRECKRTGESSFVACESEFLRADQCLRFRSACAASRRMRAYSIGGSCPRALSRRKHFGKKPIVDFRKLGFRFQRIFNTDFNDPFSYPTLLPQIPEAAERTAFNVAAVTSSSTPTPQTVFPSWLTN